MADIFVSYARKDRETAAKLVQLFEDKGWSVWWDTKLLPGERWNKVIGSELDKARCLVALWSRQSIDSRWLEIEASAALQRRILIPVLLEDVRLPPVLHNIQAADLRDWYKTGSTHGVQRLLEAIEATFLGAVEVVQSTHSIANVREYLGSLQAGYNPLNEVKVILVGNGGSGKTSLLKRLIGKPFNSNEPQTHGITILQKPVTCGTEEVKINFWDFGGQEIMHSTHQFFLSKRSLYVLVLDGRKEEDPEYWLQLILSFGGTSPIIIALNKIDQQPSFEVNRKFLQDKYAAIKAFHRISCRTGGTGGGIDSFSTTLRREVANIDHIKTPLPRSWFLVKKKLEVLTEDYISFDKYEEICCGEGITKHDTVDALADLLNDLGVVLHFDTMILRETNVINPAWITGAVYKILNSKQLADGKGMLKRNDLTEILDLFLHPKRKHDYIVELMKKFELCFSLDDDTLLIPDLLDVEEPQFVFEEEKALKFVFEYEFLPRSVVPRLIVNMHTDIVGNLRWRTGAVLENELFDANAVIRADEREKKIFIFVLGGGRREYLSIIRKVVLDIHRNFYGLVWREMVPCICEECQRRSSKHFFDYGYLLQRRRKGKKTVDCQRSIEEVSLSDLFEGFEAPGAEPHEGWDVFVSYATKDASLVGEIVKDLKGHRIRCWYDYEQIHPGDFVSQKIEIGLRKSRFILPCISRNQVQSGWCRIEYASILQRVISGKTSQKVVPLIIDDLPEEDLPLLLGDCRSERLSDRRSYERLVAFFSGG